MFQLHAIKAEEKASASYHSNPPIHSTPISLGFFKGLEVLKLHPDCVSCDCMVTSYGKINFHKTRAHFKCWTCECDNLLAIGSVRYKPREVNLTWNNNKAIGSLSQIRTGKLFQK
jgi:hypothetical protein